MVVRIVGDTAGFNKSLTDTQKKMVAFGVNSAAMSAAVVLAAKAVAKAVGNFTDYGSAIFDASQKTGLSTKAIQEWKFIAEQSGTTLQTITSSVALMTKGLVTNAELFKQLGIETKNTNGTFRTTTEIFNDTITKLSSMKDATERDQLAFKLLGRGAQEMIPILNAGGGALDAMRQEAHDLGIVLSDEVIVNADKLGDNIDALKASFQATGNELISSLAPALISISNGLKELITEWNSLDKGSKSFLITLTALAVGIIPLVMGFINLGKAITGVKATLELLQTSKALAKAVSGGWVTLAIAGVVALGVAFIALTRSAEESRKKLAEIERLKLGGSTEDAQASLKLLNGEYDKQRKILDSLLSVNLNLYTKPEIRKEKEDDIARQKEVVQQLANTIKLQIRNIDNLLLTANGTQYLAEEERKRAKLQEDLAKLEADLIKLGLDGNIKQVEGEKWVYDETLNFANDEADKLISLDEWVAQNEEKNREKKLSAEKVFYAELQSLAWDTYSSIADLISTLQNNILTTQQENQTEELRLLEKKFDDALITEEEYEASKLAIEKRGRAEQYQIEKSKFLTTQAFALGKAFIDNASAILKSLSIDPTGVLAIVTALAGAAQIATILAQKPPSAPTFANGGIVQPQPGGVQALVAEAGQAEAIIPLDKLDQMLARAGGSTGEGNMMNLTLQMDSNVIYSGIFEATRNRTVLISQGAVV